MIKADKAILDIKGEYADVVFELNHILEYFVKENPEVLGGAIAVWGDILKTALSTDDTSIEILECTREVTEHYIQMREELNNE
jgi:HEPN domain-containing protein